MAGPGAKIMVVAQVGFPDTQRDAPIISTNTPSSNTIQSNTIPVTPVVVGNDETRENGMAAILDGTEGNRKYLAHHRSVRPGTIIRVKNNMTRKEVFVRVIGNLPSTESPDVLLRLSKSAYEVGWRGQVCSRGNVFQVGFAPLWFIHFSCWFFFCECPEPCSKLWF